MFNFIKPKRRLRSVRRGVAMTEVAFCLPVVILLALGTVEVCSTLFLKESLAISAFEGARVGVKRRATATDAMNAVNHVLTERGIQNAVVTIIPDDFSTLSALDPITVEVEVPVNQNSAFVNRFFAGRTVRASVSMVREFDD